MRSKADALAYDGMVLAAKGLIKTEFIDIVEDPDVIVREFRTRFFDTRALLRQIRRWQVRDVSVPAAQEHGPCASAEAAHRLVEEAQLFLEASHACQARLAARPV